jgi:kynurenine formamidase
MRRRTKLTVTAALVATATLAYLAGAVGGAGAGAAPGGRTLAGGFSRVVFLSHPNDPKDTPVFPGDPAFSMSTAFTVPKDGYYLQYVKEGEHTGTHYSAPCHFHVDALCADRLAPGDFVLPAVVVDVRAEVANDVDHHVTVADLKAWEAANGPIPHDAAVLLWTGCDRYWSPAIGRDVPTYYNCGSADGRFRQPGFSKLAVKWLIAQGVLGKRGALGTDTFGPDPGDDPMFLETWLTLRRHRFTLENLTNLDAMPTTGGWIVIGGPRNGHGSGAPSTVFGLVP